MTNQQQIKDYLYREVPFAIYQAVLESNVGRQRDRLNIFRQKLRQQLSDRLHHLSFSTLLNVKDTLASMWLWSAPGVLNPYYRNVDWKMSNNYLGHVDVGGMDVLAWTQAASKMSEGDGDEKNERELRAYLCATMPQVIRTAIADARMQFEKLPKYAGQYHAPGRLNHQKSLPGFTGMFRTCLRRQIHLMNLPAEFRYNFTRMICSSYRWKAPGVLNPNASFTFFRKPGYGVQPVTIEPSVVQSWVEFSSDLINKPIEMNPVEVKPVSPRGMRWNRRAETANLRPYSYVGDARNLEPVGPSYITKDAMLNEKIANGILLPIKPYYHNVVLNDEKSVDTINTNITGFTSSVGSLGMPAKWQETKLSLPELTKPVERIKKDPFDENLESLDAVLKDIWADLEVSLGYTQDLVALQETIR